MMTELNEIPSVLIEEQVFRHPIHVCFFFIPIAN